MWRLRREVAEEGRGWWESWGWLGGGVCTQGLVNGYTMCRETRSSTLQQTALSSQRERQSGRGGIEGERGRKGLLFSHFVYRLSLASTQTCEDQGIKHTDWSAPHSVPSCRHARTLNVSKQTKTRAEIRKWERHTFTPTSTRTAWLSESTKSQASIQFIRGLLAAVLV